MTTAHNKPIAVIKVGGDMVAQAAQRKSLARNVAGLFNAGWQCLILHGGGPQVSALQKAHGLRPHKVEGRRVTNKADLQVIKQALCGEVNVDLVSALLAEGLPAFGCHGASATLIEANKRPPMKLNTHGMVDFGEVGDVASINHQLLNAMFSINVIPVIASLGVSKNGRIFNINADTTVAAIAKSLKADLLILCTQVGGVFHDISDPSSRIATINPRQAEQLIEQGIIRDGMIPKVQEALTLLSQGVKEIIITNASKPNNFITLGQFVTHGKAEAQHGTRLVPDND